MQFLECRDLNPGLQGEKHECNLCAMPTLLKRKLKRIEGGFGGDSKVGHGKWTFSSSSFFPQKNEFFY